MEAGATAVGAADLSSAIEERRVGRLVLAYVGASTLFLFVSGLLGAVLRESQSDLVRIRPNVFYAIMTAHGLGAFVAWAGFAVMGLSLWVLAESGFRMRPAGFALAKVAWWTMVVGVVLIVVTTLGMGFGASWVFLYPLPFHGAGEWGDTATGIFSFGVLLTGVSIITWGMAVWHTVVGPGLRAQEGAGFFNRTGSALGFGLLWPRRFSVVPYAVIPLTVIAIDMIIATLPLAALLVEMIAQSIDPSVTIDALLAKNMLWYFGHPVVYLLLFPAVSIFYLLVPRYARKELVAGRVVGFAWLVAVVVNVVVWAHHIYTDYPDATIQGALNTAAQPLTFAIVLPSAISLYSLSATIWRSDYQWTPAAKFLAAAMVSWLVAGLQGIINATAVLDQVVHNTMWIVGHFHNMALLNIGLVIFAGIYAFLPRLTGHEWYSDRLSNSHLWLTVVGGYGMVIPMLVAGLEGAPRRYAVLPTRFDTLTQVTLPFVVMTALGQVVFAYNLVQSLRGKRRERHETLRASVGLTAALLGAAAVVAGSALALDHANAGEQPQKPGLSAAQGDPGAKVFTTNCASCHTLQQANATGTVGPNLDQLKPDQARVLAAIKRGGTGSGTMPANIVQGKDAQAVAQFVAKVAGR